MLHASRPDTEHCPGTTTLPIGGRPRNPILVTGAPRSGSTWVGNIFALDPATGYIHEPFNKNCPDGRCRARFAHGFTYVTEENEALYLEALHDTIAWKYSIAAELKAVRTLRRGARLVRDFAYFETNRQRGARPILKDPLALFSADWIARRFDARVVVVIRHPAAFVASLRAAGWQRVPFWVFQSQARLMQDRLAPFAAEIAAAAAAMPDPIDAGVLLWRILHHHIDLLRQEHPDWIFVRHEDVSRDPVTAFSDLFAQLDLDFSPTVRNKLESFTTDRGALGKLSLFGTRRRTMRDSKQTIRFFEKRLTPEEIARIRAAAAPLSERFYSDADW